MFTRVQHGLATTYRTRVCEVVVAGLVQVCVARELWQGFGAIHCSNRFFNRLAPFVRLLGNESEHDDHHSLLVVQRLCGHHTNYASVP